MKKSEMFGLGAILLVSALLSVALLTRGHLWWDDFTSYIMQAQSLLHGTTREFIQHNTFTVLRSSYPPGPIAYPWGYPLLMAPVLAVFGLKVLALKLINTFFFILFLIVFYRLARLRLAPIWSLFLTAILAFNPALLQAHDLLLSDIPFLFFSTLSLLLIEQWIWPNETQSSFWKLSLIGITIFASFAMRTNGLLLLGPLAVAQYLHFRSLANIRKNWLSILPPYLIFGALTVIQYLILPGGQEAYLSHYGLLFTPQHLIGNIFYYLALPAAFFKEIPLSLFFFAITVILFLAGIIAGVRKNLVFLSYIALTFVLFISWPETQGLRFIFPILPLFLLIAAEGLKFGLEKSSVKILPVFRWASIGAAGTLIVLSLIVSAKIGWGNLQNGRDINGPFDSVSNEMFDFVREQTPANSVIIFFKPRAMRLFTDRDSFMTQNCADLSAGNYVAIHEKQGDNGQIGDVLGCSNVSLQTVFNNKRFTVYQIFPK